LDEAIEQLRAECSGEIRRSDFAAWVVNMINLGGTLTLVGKCSDFEGEIGRLEEAVDTFREVLCERRVVEFPYERAMVHINMAEALRSMGELAFPGRRAEYLLSAVNSLAVALSLVAPRRFRCLVEVDPRSFV
jgi:hypothetical protein